MKARAGQNNIAGRGAPPTHSVARVDALVCPVMVDTAFARALLPTTQHLSLALMPHVPAGRHLVIVEIWRVHDGRMEAAGIDAHGWSELAGAAAGFGMGGGAGAAVGAGLGSITGGTGGGMLGLWMGPLGFCWGVVAGAAAGAATGAALAATAGSLYGAKWAGSAARKASQMGSHVMGSYNEILVTIPCVRRAHGGARNFSFVAGMYTDSTLSRVGEQMLSFGYGKQPAQIVWHNDGDQMVITVSAGRSARASTNTATAAFTAAVDGAHAQSGNETVRTDARATLNLLTRPLLGVTRSGRLEASSLDRLFDDGAARLMPAGVHLDARSTFVPALPRKALTITSVGSDNPWGAFWATGVPVRLSYPRAVR
jgi:hypothetical protein